MRTLFQQPRSAMSAVAGMGGLDGNHGAALLTCLFFYLDILESNLWNHNWTLLPQGRLPIAM